MLFRWDISAFDSLPGCVLIFECRNYGRSLPRLYRSLFSKTYCPFSKRLKKILNSYVIRDMKVMELDTLDDMVEVQVIPYSFAAIFRTIWTPLAGGGQFLSYSSVVASSAASTRPENGKTTGISHNFSPRSAPTPGGETS